MAMDKDRLGDAILSRIISLTGAGEFANYPGAETILRQYWRAIAEEIISEIDAHADIVLSSGDIISDTDAVPHYFDGNSLQVTGTADGINRAVILSGKIE